MKNLFRSQVLLDGNDLLGYKNRKTLNTSDFTDMKCGVKHSLHGNPQKDYPEGRIRKKIMMKGVVQGVGFRPFVHHLAQSYDLKGFVLNSSEGVLIGVKSSVFQETLENLKYIYRVRPTIPFTETTP